MTPILYRLAQEVLRVGILVNEHTERAVFIDFSGHVKWITVDISESKTCFTEKVYQRRIFLKDARLAEKLLMGAISRLNEELPEDIRRLCGEEATELVGSRAD